MAAKIKRGQHQELHSGEKKIHIEQNILITKNYISTTSQHLKIHTDKLPNKRMLYSADKFFMNLSPKQRHIYHLILNINK